MEKEIQSEKSETPNLDFAGFGLRLIAYLIDIIPIIIILNIFIFFAFGINPLDSGDRMIDLDGQEFKESTITRVIVRYISFFIWIIYCSFMEATNRKGTFGKRVVGIEVTTEEGNQLTVGNSILRNFSKLVSYIVIGLGFLWVLFNKRKRGWHDLIAKTKVIKRIN